MKKILLVCAGGLSTGMLVQRMRQAAAAKGIDVEMDAIAEVNLDAEIDNISIVMLGPQMGHAKGNIEAKYGDRLPITVIDMMDYGMMNGEKVFATALELIENFKK